MLSTAVTDVTVPLVAVKLLVLTVPTTASSNVTVNVMALFVVADTVSVTDVIEGAVVSDGNVRELAGAVNEPADAMAVVTELTVAVGLTAVCRKISKAALLPVLIVLSKSTALTSANVTLMLLTIAKSRPVMLKLVLTVLAATVKSYLVKGSKIRSLLLLVKSVTTASMVACTEALLLSS